jgi:spermidine synthase
MMVHVSFAINPKISNVLIIGGGDGGIARELCRYKTLKHIDMIDIDKRVCEVSKKYFPEVSKSLTDKRLNLMHIDGIK